MIKTDELLKTAAAADPEKLRALFDAAVAVSVDALRCSGREAQVMHAVDQERKRLVLHVELAPNPDASLVLRDYACGVEDVVAEMIIVDVKRMN
jgi:hypothetical protein